RALAAARDRGARAIIRDSQLAGRRAIAPGLRAILESCLDPQAAGRYRRGLELAEDLDRWRTHRPLAFAAEPFWSQTVPRWLRRQRRMLTVAALALLTIGLVTTAIVLRGSNQALHHNLQRIASDKLARHWDDPEAGAFLRSQRPQAPRFLEPDDRQAIEI